MRALDFGELDDLRKKYGGTDQVFPLPDPSQVKPALVIKPHRDEARVQSLGAEVVNWEEI
jgi:anaerobic dimethyl sulfoxide reductase subunit B (iron-sulfur subunit)